MMKTHSCVNFWRYIMLLFLCISMTLTLLVLGLDLDWLINGPAFMARICARIKERFSNEEVPADEEDLLKNLSLASESVWLQLFVIMVVAVTCVFVIINMIGCAGTCLLSYSLLSGFTIFMMLSSILAVTVACSLLLPLHSSKMDSPLAPLAIDLINKYKIEEGGSAKIVIDTVQTQLQCCGYDDMLDWRPEEVAIIGRGVSRDNVTIRDQDWLPRSCCGAAPCTQDKAFREPCKLKLRENALNPNTAIGIIGIFVIILVSFIVSTFLISLIMCCIARRWRGMTWSVVNWKPRDSSDCIASS
jgi:uncharacterized membrane protein YgcG